MYLFGKRSSSSQRFFLSKLGRFEGFFNRFALFELSCPPFFVCGRYVLAMLTVVDGVVVSVVRVNGNLVVGVYIFDGNFVVLVRVRNVYGRCVV